MSGTSSRATSDGSHPAALAGILLAIAVALRLTTFGDPNLHGDEVFYWTVGKAMHLGALPYVDVWDRKPFGLFALYWAITAVSGEALAYQIAATLCAAATAWLIALFARSWTGTFGSLCAGTIYLLYLAPLQGFGGQSPVFYNLFIAGAALLVFRALPALRAGRVPVAMPLAMLIAGTGITLKTTAFAEAAFLGLYGTAVLARSPLGLAGAMRQALPWALIGAAPTLAIALGYGMVGHWPEFWHAMIVSNLEKTPHWQTSVARLKVLALVLVPIALLAALGLRRMPSPSRWFVSAWALAAVAGLCSMPNFYLHYAMPLVVPLCVMASGLLDNRLAGMAATGLLAVVSLAGVPPQPGHAAASRAAIERLVSGIRTHIGKGPLLLYDAPPQLYVESGQGFTTPLVFPTHLSHGIEKDTSPLSTLAETRRVLALRPSVVVMAAKVRNEPVNAATRRAVLAYLGRHCRMVDAVTAYEWVREDTITLWAGCRD